MTSFPNLKDRPRRRCVISWIGLRKFEAILTAKDCRSSWQREWLGIGDPEGAGRK